MTALNKAQAVGLVTTSLRPPRTAQEFHFGMAVLNWNRKQTDPPIDVGRELWVADELLKMLAFNDRPAPPPAQQVAVPMPMTKNQIAKWWASENDLEDCDMCIYDDFEKVVRAIEAHHGIKGVNP